MHGGRGNLKKSGIINPHLCEAIASLGHTDSLTICDAGLPIPAGVRRIDVTVCRGVPTFEQVLMAIAPELEVERVVMAEEALKENPGVVDLVRRAYPRVNVEFVPHERFKKLVEQSKAVVRTAEFRPYSNVLLYSGVEGLFEDSAGETTTDGR